MQNFREQIKVLRQTADQLHREILAAVDALEASFEGLDAMFANLTSAAARVNRSAAALESGDRQASGSDTLIQKVNDAIGLKPKTVEAISAETGIPEEKVRGVLYNPPTRDRVVKVKINKRLHFISKRSATKARSRIRTAVALREGSNRKRVIKLLAQSPGATMEQIEARTGLTRTQVKTVIYAQDSRHLFRCVELAGIGHFHLVPQNEPNEPASTAD